MEESRALESRLLEKVVEINCYQCDVWMDGSGEPELNKQPCLRMAPK